MGFPSVREWWEKPNFERPNGPRAAVGKIVEIIFQAFDSCGLDILDTPRCRVQYLGVAAHGVDGEVVPAL
jgi:hypothetical protein